MVDKDDTVAIKDRWWQIDKCRWRHTLAGQTVTIHQRLDDSISIRLGPHVVGHYPEGRGKDGSHRLDGGSPSASQTKGQEGSMKPNRTTNVLIKPDNLQKLTTAPKVAE